MYFSTFLIHSITYDRFIEFPILIKFQFLLKMGNFLAVLVFRLIPNLFQTNVLFQHLHKTLQNLWFPNMFRGYGKRTSGFEIKKILDRENFGK